MNNPPLISLCDPAILASPGLKARELENSVPFAKAIENTTEVERPLVPPLLTTVQVHKHLGWSSCRSMLVRISAVSGTMCNSSTLMCGEAGCLLWSIAPADMSSAVRRPVSQALTQLYDLLL